MILSDLKKKNGGTRIRLGATARQSSHVKTMAAILDFDIFMIFSLFLYVESSGKLSVVGFGW